MAELYGNGVVLTEKVLDYLWQRQTVSLNNVANVDTPGFKSQYITFEEELNKRLSEASASGSPRKAVAQAIDSSKLRVHTTRSETVRSAYEYQYVLSSFNSDITRLKNAAKSF